MFEAVLLQPLLRPLIRGIGFADGYELTLLAQGVAERDTAFAALLAHQLGVAPE